MGSLGDESSVRRLPSAVVGEENRTVVPSVGISPSDGIMLTTMTSAIRDALKHVKRLTSTDARRLLVPLSDLPRAYVASLLTLNINYVKELMFQAKVDKLYLSHGLTLQTYSETHSRVCQEVIHYAVSFVYSNDNISRLAWEAKKRSPNKDVRWKDLKNVSAMKSLVLKHDIATMYKVYLEKHKNEMPNKMPVGKTLFYDIVNHITGGGKHQEARSGIDYIKVNFHKDNLSLLTKSSMFLCLSLRVNHTLREKLYSLRSDTYTFINYCYAVHIREAVEAFNETVSHLPPQEHDGQQFSAYQQLNELLRHPDSLDEPATQQHIGFREGGDSYYGKRACYGGEAGAYVKPCVEVHNEIVEPLEKLHVMIDFARRNVPLQQQMEQVNEDGELYKDEEDDDDDDDEQHEDEDGDQQEDEDGDQQHEDDDGDQQHEDEDGDEQHEDDDGDQQHEDDDGVQQHEDDDGDQHEDEDGDQQHEDDDGGDQQHEDEDGDQQHEDDDGDQHEDEDGDQQHEDDDDEQHEDDDGGDQQHEDEDGDQQHEDEDGDQQHEDEDGDQQHEDEDGDQQHEDEDGDQQHEDEDGDQQHEDEDGDQQHEDEDGDQHEDEDGDQQHEDDDGDQQHEDDDGDQHEDEDGDQQHEDDDDEQHEDDDGGDQQHEDEDGDQHMKMRMVINMKMMMVISNMKMRMVINMKMMMVISNMKMRMVINMKMMMVISNMKMMMVINMKMRMVINMKMRMVISNMKMRMVMSNMKMMMVINMKMRTVISNMKMRMVISNMKMMMVINMKMMMVISNMKMRMVISNMKMMMVINMKMMMVISNMKMRMVINMKMRMQHEDDDGDQHEDEDGDQQHEDDDDEQHEDDDGGDQQHEDEDGDQQHEDEDDDEQHEDDDGDQQHEDEDGDQQHEGDDYCIVQGEQKADSSVVLSCLEAAFHALRKRFPHIKKVIVQSDNAKNFGGKHTKLLLPYVCSAAGLKLVAYYHNEAQSGKDVCDTHFSHQQTHVNTYLIQGEGGRKVSTPKQLAVALMENPIMNTTVLLLKLDFKAPYRSTVVPCVSGISDFYASQYVTTVNEEKIVRFYNSLGQKVPSKCVSIPSCEASHEIGSKSVNFTGVTVLLSSDNTSNCEQAKKDKKRYMYKRGSLEVSKHRKQLIENQSKDERALDMIRAIYPQCAKCLYHFKSPQLLKKHVCTGTRESWDALSVAMRHADHLLATMDFSITGAIDQTASMFLDDGDTPPYATFEPNFFAGWAHTKKNMHPELTTKVRSVIHECWRAGENKELGKVKISAAGVYDRFEEMQLQKTIRLSELSIRLSELPIRLSELPIRLSELSIRLCELPIRLCELSIRLSELSIRLSELSIRLSELSIRLSELSIRLCLVSLVVSCPVIRLSELSIRLSELSIRLSELSIRLSELSIRLSELPIRLSELTIRLSELPIRLSELPIRLSELSIRLSELPIRLCELSIRLSELPLPGKILAVYKSIGSKPQVPSAGSYKRGRPLSSAGVTGRKKAKVCYSDCDKQKDLSKWNKQELQAYLIHHNLKKSGNKPDLVLHIRQHMDTV
eukprot:Em0095g2a